MYDITDKQSFKDIETWLAEVDKFANDNVVKLLVGNKCDMEQQRAVTYDEGKEFADQLGIKFLETSAKNAVKVEEAFFTLADEIKSRIAKPDDSTTRNPTDKPKPGSRLGAVPID